MSELFRDEEGLRAFLTTRCLGMSNKELTPLVNAEFGTTYTVDQLKSFISNRKIDLQRNRHFSREEEEWIIANGKGRTDAELARLFNEHFGDDRPLSQIVSKRYRLGAKSGIDSRFKPGSKTGASYRFPKGHVPWTKGRKAEEFMTPAQVEAFRARRWKKGQEAHNRMEVGSEVVGTAGYWLVKVAEPSTWKMKHVLLWEEAHGKVPEGYVITFLDSNPLNCTLENLMLISKSEHSYINHKNRRSENAEATRAQILIKRVENKIREREEER